MKITKYKNGKIIMTAQNNNDSHVLTKMLANIAGKDSNFAKLHQKKIKTNDNTL